MIKQNLSFCSTIIMKFSAQAGSILLGCLLGFSSITANARPNIQPLPANIAQTGSAFYQFKTLEFDSKDHQRHYRVWLGIPKQAAPTQGYAALYMLDGNSAMSHLQENVLKQLSKSDAPVLVAVGYQSNLPYDVNARAQDYTPADASGNLQPDLNHPERITGGSAEFRQLLLDKIVPWVNQQTQINPQQTALWGHSYGGLFVLDTYLNSNYFQSYFAASPSIHWQNGRIQQMLNQATPAQLQHKHLSIIEGDVQTPVAAEDQDKQIDELIDQNREIVRQLHRKGADVKLVVYPDLRHGEVFPASLLDVITEQRY